MSEINSTLLEHLQINDQFYAEHFTERARAAGYHTEIRVDQKDGKEIFAAIVMPQTLYDQIIDRANHKAAQSLGDQSPAPIRQLPLERQPKPSPGAEPKLSYVSRWQYSRKAALHQVADQFMDYWSRHQVHDSKGTGYYENNHDFNRLQQDLPPVWESERMHDWVQDYDLEGSENRYGVTFIFPISTRLCAEVPDVADRLNELFYPPQTDNLTEVGIYGYRRTEDGGQHLVEVDMDWPISGNISTKLTAATAIILDACLEPISSSQEAAA